MATHLTKEYWSIDHGKELLHALESTDQTALKALLDNDRTTMKKAMYMSNMTHLLKVAIRRKNPEIVSMLLQRGVSVSQPIYSFKQTALLHAVKTRHQKIITDILQRTADWKVADSRGRTALHLIIENEEPAKRENMQWRRVNSRTQATIIEICKIFLNLGMEVDVETKSGETPLYLAVKYEMRKVAKFFIECGASIDICNEKCDSLLHLLVKNEFNASEKYCYNVERLKRNRNESAKFMDLLLSKGLNVDCKNYNGETATQLAIERNIIHLLPTLFKYTRNVNFLSKYNKTSLHLILLKNNKENGHCSLTSNSEAWSISESNNIVEVLLNRGASVDAIDSKGRTPLHIALEQKRYKIVLRILKRFTNIRASNEHGNTVLHIAVQNLVNEYSSELKRYKHEDENLRIIRTLLSKGADPEIKNKKGMTPIHIAAENKLVTILEMFKRHGADFSIRTRNGENIMHLISKNNIKVHYFSYDAMLNLLMNSGCDVNATTKDGLTPLHLAVISRSFEIVKVLLTRGANVNFQQKKTLLTPLHLACTVGVTWNTKNLQSTVDSLQQPSKDFHKVSDDVIWKLIRSGADVNARDTWGRTPLHLATYRRSCIIQTLLDLGARIDAQDNNGRLPLQNVLDYDNVEGLRTLLEFGVDINDIASVSHLSDQLDSHGMSVQDYVMKHLTKLRAADLSIAKVYEPIFRVDKSRWQQCYAECLREVERLKSFVVEDGVSLYDVLHMNPWHRYHYYTKNTKLMNISFKLEFSIYHNILKASKREALERKSLLGPAKKALYKLIKYNLPDICVDHILSYLKISTLTVMATVLRQPISNEKSFQWRKSYRKMISPLIKARDVMQLSRITILSSFESSYVQL